jgi:hypothetical protein
MPLCFSNSVLGRYSVLARGQVCGQLTFRTVPAR